jgi:hypothetical protein
MRSKESVFATLVSIPVIIYVLPPNCVKTAMGIASRFPDLGSRPDSAINDLRTYRGIREQHARQHNDSPTYSLDESRWRCLWRHLDRRKREMVTFLKIPYIDSQSG